MVLGYAQSIRDGRKRACTELKQAVERFFHDLENSDYELDHKAPEFCIQIIESTFCHQQGEKLDGTPLRGTPSVSYTHLTAAMQAKEKAPAEEYGKIRPIREA